MILRRSARWFDDRLRASSFAHEALNKIFPDNWSFMLGEIALYCFVILVLTGTFLTFFFEPSSHQVLYSGSYAPLRGEPVSAAYASVVKLSFEVRAGLVMRQVHHWSALVFVGAIVLHLCRVFFTGAFRRPRELNWLIGVTMLLLGILNGFTGYSLPDDLLSGTGLRIAYSVALSVPFVGTWTAFLLFGGEFPADQIISRLFIIHVMIVPGLLIGLIAAHLAILWRQKHTQFPGPGRTESNVVGSKLWPTYAAKSIGLFLGVAAVLALLGGLVQINPVWQYGPFNPAQVSTPAQPDWYLGWLEGAIRLIPAVEIRLFHHTVPNPFFGGVLLPGATFLLLYAWPFLEAKASGDRDTHHLLDRPRDHPLRTAIGATALTFFSLLFLAASNDIMAKYTRLSVLGITMAFRVLVLVIPPLVGFGFYRLMRALRDSEAASFLEVPMAGVVRLPRASPFGDESSTSVRMEQQEREDRPELERREAGTAGGEEGSPA